MTRWNEKNCITAQQTPFVYFCIFVFLHFACLTFQRDWRTKEKLSVFTSIQQEKFRLIKNTKISLMKFFYYFLKEGRRKVLGGTRCISTAQSCLKTKTWSKQSLLAASLFALKNLFYLTKLFHVRCCIGFWRRSPPFSLIFSSHKRYQMKNNHSKRESRAKDEIKLSKQQRFKCWKNVESGKMGIEHLRNHFDRKFSPAQQTREFYIVKPLCILDFFEHFPMMHHRHQHQAL